MEEDLVVKFWKEYLRLDYFQRRRKIVFIVEIIDNLRTIKDKKIRQHAIGNILSCYFDDLERYLEEQNENKKVE